MTQAAADAAVAPYSLFVNASVLLLQVMAGAFAERKVLLKQKQAELDAQARFLAGEQQHCMQ